MDFGELEYLLAVQSNGDLNPAQKSRLEELKRANPNIGGVNGGIPQFQFDYAGEATKAYGELGAYYDRILKESQGDLNKALSRLTQDYDRGLRIKREDTATSNQGLDVQERNTTQNTIDNALTRGLYRKSNYGDGRGIYDENLKQGLEPINMQRAQNALGMSRYEEEALINKQRQETDLPEQQKRNEFDMEQNRRKEAAGLAETRGARAYQDFQAKIPTYI